MKTEFKLPKFKLRAEHILYTVAAANAVRLAWAYAYADAGGNLFSAPGAAGTMMGLTVSVSVAFVAGKLPGVRGKARIQLTWSALALILVLEPLILAPLTVTDMPHSLRATLPFPLDWLWSIILALLPSLALAAVSLANGSMIEATAQAPASDQASETAKPKSGKKPADVPPSDEKTAPIPQPAAQSEPEPAPIPLQATPSEPVSEIACRHAGAGCTRTFKSQNAENAHAGKCEFKPGAAMPAEE